MDELVALLRQWFPGNEHVRIHHRKLALSLVRQMQGEPRWQRHPEEASSVLFRGIALLCTQQDIDEGGSKASCLVEDVDESVYEGLGALVLRATSGARPASRR